jgi:hypothetical protein
MTVDRWFWRSLALGGVPALLLGAMVLPATLLRGRLPRYELPPYQDHPMAWGLPGLAIVFAAGWCLVVTLFLVTTPGGSGRRRVWELALPLLTLTGGTLVAIADLLVVENLDLPYGSPLDGGQPVAVLAAYAGLLAGGAAGLLAGRRAAALEPAGEPRAAARSVWIGDVSAGTSYWVLQGAIALVVTGVVALPAALFGGAPRAVATGVMTAGLVAVLAIWASSGRVVVSPSGIRVRFGHFAPFGWQLGIDQVVAVETVSVRLLTSRFGWRSLPHLLLRDGPALLVHTRWGGRRWITLPEAEEVAALLRGWLARGAGA